ncbi:hypothetical protein V8C44DRAFT_341270 [Trichoderma aethiopicum]
MGLKTYLLAPNFTFEPDGPIRIGNIIADPFYPLKPLSTPVHPPLTATHVDLDCTFSRESDKSLHGSLWAKFLQNANGKIGQKLSKDIQLQYTIDSLETIRIKDDPSDEEAMNRIREPKVQSAIKAGLSGAAPVYMITGLKVAKGFRMNKKVTISRQKASLGIGFSVAEGVVIGADGNVTHSTTTSETFQSSSSIIFAYQLHIIGPKSWWRRRIGIDVYAPKSAFLNTDEDVEEEEGVVIECCEHSHLLEIAEENEYPRPKVLEAVEAKENCHCIAYEEV